MANAVLDNTKSGIEQRKGLNPVYQDNPTWGDEFVPDSYERLNENLSISAPAAEPVQQSRPQNNLNLNWILSGPVEYDQAPQPTDNRTSSISDTKIATDTYQPVVNETAVIEIGPSEQDLQKIEEIKGQIEKGAFSSSGTMVFNVAETAVPEVFKRATQDIELNPDKSTAPLAEEHYEVPDIFVINTQDISLDPDENPADEAAASDNGIISIIKGNSKSTDILSNGINQLKKVLIPGVGEYFSSIFDIKDVIVVKPASPDNKKAEVEQAKQAQEARKRQAFIQESQATQSAVAQQREQKEFDRILGGQPITQTDLVEAKLNANMRQTLVTENTAHDIAQNRVKKIEQFQQQTSPVEAMQATGSHKEGHNFNVDLDKANEGTGTLSSANSGAGG